MVYNFSVKEAEELDKLLKDDDVYLSEPDYSGPEYNDMGEMDDEDFNQFVVKQLETEQWTMMVNGG
jgi:hypothetical protein